VLLILTRENFIKVLLGQLRDHVHLCVLGVVREVIDDALADLGIAKGKLLKVVFQIKLVEEVLFFLLELVKEPHVSVRGKEHLAWHLIHLVSALDAASDVIFELLFDVLVLYICYHVPVGGVNILQQRISILPVDFIVLKLIDIFSHESLEAGSELEVENGTGTSREHNVHVHHDTSVRVTIETTSNEHVLFHNWREESDDLSLDQPDDADH